MTTHTPMNKSDIAFPAAQADLKVKRSRPAPAPEDAAPAEGISREERRRLEQDLEALRVQEQNLLAYEMRLREWQAQLDEMQQGTRFIPVPAARYAAPLPPAGESGLHEGWTKLHRARALLEVEQKHLVDDRLALREHETALRQFEERLAAREQRVAEREKTHEAAPPETAETVTAPTRSPFAMAKSMLGMKA